MRVLSDWLAAFFFGDDVFISYARADTTPYAAALADQLTEKGFACYIDQWTTEPGRELPQQLKRAIGLSGIFVLLGSAAAANSRHVKLEIDEFLDTGRPFILVKLSSRMESAEWFPEVSGAATTVDALDHTSSEPSAEVVKRIINSFGSRTRNQRLKRTFWLVLLAIIAVLTTGWVGAREIVSRAAKDRAAAITQRDRAVDDANDASSKAAAAKAEKATADHQLAAITEASSAMQQYDENPYTALSSIVHTVAGDDEASTRTALLYALMRNPHLQSFIDNPARPQQNDVDHLEFVPGRHPALLAVIANRMHSWDLNGKRATHSFTNPDRISAVVASDDVIALASQGVGANNPYLLLVRPDLSGAIRKIKSSANYIATLAFAGPHQIFGLANFEGILSWDLKTDSEEWVVKWADPAIRGAKIVTGAFAVSPKGTKVAVGDLDDKDAVTLFVKASPDHWEKTIVLRGGRPKDLSFEDDDHLTVARQEGDVVERDLRTGEEKTWSTRRESYIRQRLSPDAQVAAFEDYNNAIHLSFHGMDKLEPLTRSSRLVANGPLIFSKDGHLLATAVDPGHIGVWDLTSGPLGMTRMGSLWKNVVALNTEVGSKRILALEGGNNYSLLGVCNGTVHRSVVSDHIGFFVALSLGSDMQDALTDPARCKFSWRIFGTRFDDALVMIRPGRHGNTTTLLQRGVGQIGGTRLAATSDGRYVAHCGKGFTILNVSDPDRPHDATPRNMRPQCREGSPIAFDASGQFVAVVTGHLDQVEIWDLKKEALVITMPEHEFDQVWSLAFSPDRNTLAVGLQGGRIQLWSIDLLAPQATRLIPAGSLHLENQDVAILALAFAKDGNRLYVTNGNAVYEIPFGTKNWIAVANKQLFAYQH